MKYNIFLDDKRHPRDAYFYTKNKRYIELQWLIVKSYDEFVYNVINIGLHNINYVSLDHDLADEHYFKQNWETTGAIDYFSYKEKTGYEALKWMCEYSMDNNVKIPKILIHTFNSVGATNMYNYYKNFIKYNPELC